jgi:hypothetical protein
MNKETVSFQMKSRTGDAVTFHLGVISVAQDKEYEKRFLELADLSAGERAKRSFQIYVDALAEWSEAVPTKTNDAGDEVPLTESVSPAEAVRAYFSERTNSKEWMAMSAINVFRNGLYPTVNFL